MTNEQESIIIQMFYDSLDGWDWDTWNYTSSGDRESIVVDVITELGLTTDIDEVYDLFYDWSGGLTEESFNN
jgi:hypothetical protein